MSSFLGTLLSWPVLVGIIAVIAIILLVKFLTSKAKTIQTILGYLELADGLILGIMPDKYEEVYKSLIAAVKRVSDGVFTRDEALITARDVFAKTLEQLNITLSDAEKAIIDQILVFAIELTIKDQAAGVAAITTVCDVKGFKF